MDFLRQLRVNKLCQDAGYPQLFPFLDPQILEDPRTRVQETAGGFTGAEVGGVDGKDGGGKRGSRVAVANGQAGSQGAGQAQASLLDEPEEVQGLPADWDEMLMEEDGDEELWLGQGAQLQQGIGSVLGAPMSAVGSEQEQQQQQRQPPGLVPRSGRGQQQQPSPVLGPTGVDEQQTVSVS